jgi:hypothetical protein
VSRPHDAGAGSIGKGGFALAVQTVNAFAGSIENLLVFISQAR